MFLRMAGFVAILMGLWFIPKNLWRYAHGGALPRIWPERSRRRIVAAWWVIISTYLLAGMSVFVFGASVWRMAMVLMVIAHLAFLAVPCQFDYFNCGVRRTLRNMLFVLLSLLFLSMAIRP